MARNKIEVDISEILSLVNCAEDYGWRDLLPDFAKWLDYKLTEEEIEEYCGYFLSYEAEMLGYTEEDYDSARMRLEEFKDYYCKED